MCCIVIFTVVILMFLTEYCEVTSFVVSFFYGCVTGYELIFQLLFVISILVKLYRRNISFMPMLESMFYLLLNRFLPVHKKTSNKSLRAILVSIYLIHMTINI